MTPFTHDVLIIGGGPAGASAAIRARAAGLDTLVVERSAFPRFRVGESLLPEGNALLRELGVWPAVEAAGFVPKHGARFILGNDSAEKRVAFARGLVPGLDRTFQVDRARFDALLLDHARAAGAEVRLETVAREVADIADGHRVTLEAAGSPGARETVTARYVIDCGGRDNAFGSALKTDLDPAPFPRRLAIYNHFRRVPREAGPEGGDTVIVRVPDGWFWLIPIDAERTSVGLVTTAAALKSSDLAPADHFARVVATNPALARLLADAAPTMGFHVTADYSYYRRELASGRLVLAGDAGGFLDPIFSSGVYLALHSAKLAAELVVRAHREKHRPLRASERRRYTRGLKAHAGVFRRLIAAFYDDPSFAVFMHPSPPLGLGPGMTSIVAGRTRLDWPLWWRFQVFLLVCRLQRRWTLAPRIDFSTTASAAPPMRDADRSRGSASPTAA